MAEVLPRHRFGARPSPYDGRDFLLEGSPALAAAIASAAERPRAFAPTTAEELAEAGVGGPPASATLSPMPPVYDQGSTPWCVAEAITNAAAYLMHHRTGKWPPFDQRSVGNLYTLAKQVDGDPSGEGTTPRAALFQAQHVGILGTDGRRYTIGAYHSLLPSTTPETLIEQALGVMEQPVIVALPWPASWYVGSFPDGLMPSPTPEDMQNSPGGHAVFGFRYVMGHPQVNVALLALLDCIRNSWGSLWGNGQGNAYAQAVDLCRIAFDLWTFGL